MKPKFSDIKDRLRFVTFTRDDLDLGRFPDFLIIGPQRTGTTWLHGNLVEHPEVFMPVEKELYYFNSLQDPSTHPTRWGEVKTDLDWYLDFFTPSADLRELLERDCQDRHGESFRPHMLGEGTATYAAGLTAEVIDEILLLNPGVKILTMVRDPVQRAWSHAKKDLSKHANRPIDDVAESEWVAFFDLWYQKRCGRPSHYMPLWQARVPAENLFVGKFRDISQDPVALLQSVYRFLGVSDDRKYVGASAQRRINPTQDAGIPANLEAHLRQLFEEEIALLHDLDMI